MYVTRTPAEIWAHLPTEAVGAGAGEEAAGGSGKEQRRVRDMVALDCEMCYCGEVLEVTRITLLDADGKVGRAVHVPVESAVTQEATKLK